MTRSTTIRPLSRMRRAELEERAREIGVGETDGMTVPVLRDAVRARMEFVARRAAGEVVDAEVVEGDGPVSTSTEVVAVDADASIYRRLSLADEQQIVDELQGRALDDYLYSFEVDGVVVVGFSWKGVAECVRTTNGRGFTDIRVSPEHRPQFTLTQTEDGVEAWQVEVYAEDRKNGGGVWGMALQSTKEDAKPDPFARTKALNKAQRNAMEVLIPAELVATVKQQYLGEGRVKRIQGAVENLPQSERPAPLTTKKAKALVAKARTAKDELRKLNSVLLTPGKFNVLIRDAEHDYDRLQDVVEHVESLLSREQRIVALTDALRGSKSFDEYMKRVERERTQEGKVAVLENAAKAEKVSV